MKDCSQLSHIDESVHHHIDDDVGKGAGMEFFHDVLAMGDGCGDADVEMLGYLLVDESFGKKDGYFDLTGGKGTFFCRPPLVMGRKSVGMGRGGVMPRAVQFQNGLDEQLLALTDVEGRHTRYLEVAIDKHDGGMGKAAEVGCVFEIDA